MSSNAPISPTRLRQICNDACDSALEKAERYDHAETQAWNNTIISKILQSVISESSSSNEQPKYKFSVTSTIIQHLSDPRPAGTGMGTQTDEATESKGETEKVSTGSDPVRKVGRRGMHSASGAYWNNEKDGMWNHKYEGGEAKGMDIVLMIMWISV